MNFYEWLKRQTKRNDPIGDFAKDAMEDQFADENPSAWARHLVNVNASSVAMKAFESAVKEWKKTQQ